MLKSSTSLLKQALLIILTGFILSSIFIVLIVFYFNSQSPARSNLGQFSATTIAPYQQTDYDLPKRLMIPKINVDTKIDYMGIIKNGDMEAPEGPKNVGWFKLGPYPGNIGSAVIAGHYGPWPNGDKSVFAGISELKKGDKLYVEDKKGMIATFVVRKSRKYDPEANAKDVFRSSDNSAHLNLITCGGVWDEVRQSYSERLVVFADKEM